jgi:hypothetical protein
MSGVTYDQAGDDAERSDEEERLLSKPATMQSEAMRRSGF